MDLGGSFSIYFLYVNMSDFLPVRPEVKQYRARLEHDINKFLLTALPFVRICLY